MPTITTPEEEILDLNDAVEDDQVDADTDAQADDDEADEDILEIEGEEPVADDNATIRRMREHLERLEKENRSLKSSVPKVEARPRPTLEDVEYDEDKFVAALAGWQADKAALDAQAATADEPQQKLAQQFETAHSEYQRQKTQIRVPDFDALEARVEAVLSKEQQLVLVMSAKNKAAVVAALGRYPARLDALAKIESPYALAIAIADLERNVKVKPRTKGPEPEDKMRGSAPLGSSTKQKEIDKLERKMMAGGDVTDVRKRLKELRG
jgi:hypothetical protein